MGNTHFRSDVREHGDRTASFGTYAGSKVALDGGVESYIKLGTMYIITGNPSAFTKAGLNAAATRALGVAGNASVPRGTLMINASSNASISGLQNLYTKVQPATWCGAITASLV
jgi:hypothetical protein